MSFPDRNTFVPANTPTSRGCPSLSLQIPQSDPSRKAHFAKDILIPNRSLSAAIDHVSQQPLPSRGSDELEYIYTSHHALERSGDAGPHDYIHWKTVHGARPAGSWDACPCERRIFDLYDPDSEPPMKETICGREFGLVDPHSPRDGESRPKKTIADQLVSAIWNNGVGSHHPSSAVKDAAAEEKNEASGTDSYGMPNDEDKDNISCSSLDSILEFCKVIDQMEERAAAKNHLKTLNPKAVLFKMPRPGPRPLNPLAASFDVPGAEVADDESDS